MTNRTPDDELTTDEQITRMLHGIEVSDAGVEQAATSNVVVIAQAEAAQDDIAGTSADDECPESVAHILRTANIDGRLEHLATALQKTADGIRRLRDAYGADDTAVIAPRALESYAGIIGNEAGFMLATAKLWSIERTADERGWID